MTNFFDRLVARALGSEAIVHPRLPGLFEPLILEEAVQPTDPLRTEEIEGGVKPRAQAAGLLGTEATERLAVPARPDVSAPLAERSVAGKRESASRLVGRETPQAVFGGGRRSRHTPRRAATSAVGGGA